MKKRYGILGGTFNPVHIAHLIMAECFCDDMKLDKCFFVPASLSPFKEEEDSAREIMPEDRFEMTRLAAKGNPRFETDRFEIDNQGVSYTYKTVDYFCQRYADAALFMLIGTDQARFFREWKNWMNILKKVQICVAYRLGESEVNKKEIDGILTVENKKPEWISAPALDISSTDIRNRIKTVKSVRYLVPDAVLDYIMKKKLYTTSASW